MHICGTYTNASGPILHTGTNRTVITVFQGEKMKNISSPQHSFYQYSTAREVKKRLLVEETGFDSM
jgi:hypothetical protein